MIQHVAALFGQQAVAQIGHFSKGAENQTSEILQQVVAQLPVSFFERVPWRHSILIYINSNDFVEAIFYLQQTIENNRNNGAKSLLGLLTKVDNYGGRVAIVREELGRNCWQK